MREKYWKIGEDGKRRLTEAGLKLFHDAMNAFPSPLDTLWYYFPGTARWATSGRFRNDREAMEQAAAIGIWKAALTYDPQKEGSVLGLLAWASHHIRNEVQRESGCRSHGEWRTPPVLVADWSRQEGRGETKQDHEAAEAVRREVNGLPTPYRDAVKATFGLEGAPAEYPTELARNTGVSRQCVEQRAKIALDLMAPALRKFS